MPLNEADTRAKLIDPALRQCGWTEDLVFRQQTAGRSPPRRAARAPVGRTCRLSSSCSRQSRHATRAVGAHRSEGRSPPPQPRASAARNYARRFNVPFVFSSNGHQFVFYSSTSGHTSDASPLADSPIRTSFAGWQAGTRSIGRSRRPRSAHALPRREGRGAIPDGRSGRLRGSRARREGALLTLATGAGKTFIAAHLLRRLFDAGMARRALFVCDRDELRAQATTALSNLFGGEAAKVARDPEGQQRGQECARSRRDLPEPWPGRGGKGGYLFLTKNYPRDYFDVIVIDECHRSAWGSWSEVLTRNGAALQMASPRPHARSTRPKTYRGKGRARGRRITADNIGYFGEPAYSYDISQAVEDGYLAVCEIVRRDVFLRSSRRTSARLASTPTISANVVDAVTGQPGFAEDGAHYEAESFEADIVLPERTKAMARPVPSPAGNRRPHQKTIVFCVRDLPRRPRRQPR